MYEVRGSSCDIFLFLRHVQVCVESHKLSEVGKKLEDVGGRTCRRRRPAPADDDRGAIENEDALGGIAVAVRSDVANETLNPFAKQVASNDRNTDDGIELTEL